LSGGATPIINEINSSIQHKIEKEAEAMGANRFVRCREILVLHALEKN
jgi:hypothetical protein